MAEKTNPVKPEKGDKVTRIKGSEEKPKFWKPTKKGEVLEGRLISIADGGFGKVLKISTKKGAVGVNVSTFLEDIDFQDYAEETLRFTFKGLVGKRDCKTFDVEHIEKEDEVPF